MVRFATSLMEIANCRILTNPQKDILCLAKATTFKGIVNMDKNVPTFMMRLYFWIKMILRISNLIEDSNSSSTRNTKLLIKKRQS